MLIKKISFWLPFLLLLVLGLITQAQGITIPDNTGLPDGSIAGVLTTTLNWLLMIFVIIATISFVITGLQFIFSFGGASGSEAQAKKNFSYTIIAIFIVGGSLIILKTVIGLLGPSTGGNNRTMNLTPTNQHTVGGYPDNDATEAGNNANNGTVLSPGQTDTDASHEADNPTQNPRVIPGSDNLHQDDLPHVTF